jgi:beta-glucosidase
MTGADIRGRVDDLIARMTPEEKAGQLSQYFCLPIFPELIRQTEDAIAHGGVGSLLFVTDPKETNRLQAIAVGKSRLKIPLLFGFDVIHGFRTIFPVPIGMAAAWDPKMVEDVQATAAAEARAVGIHWAFAPMVDIARDPRWGRIVEGAGEDPYLGSAMAAAQVRGFQGPSIGSPGRLIAGPKHFAGYGAALGGRDYDEVDLSESQLWNVYLPPFKAAIDAGAGNIMSAYMSLNGVPASAHAGLLTKVLRETWGFEGFVSTDAGAVQSLVTQELAANDEDAAVRALNAGVDMEMARPRTDGAAFRNLPAALKAGRISEAELDRAVHNVLTAKFRMGLFDRPFVDEAKAAAVLGHDSHLKLARIAAERSAVLLRNENGFLPLDRSRLKTIAVLGPLADAPRDTLGPWVFPHVGPQAVSILAGLRAKFGDALRLDYAEGVRIPPRLFPSPFAAFDRPVERPPLDETAEIERAVALARKADVTVLVLGEAQDMVGELASRSSLDLPGRQHELLERIVATGRPVVLLLMTARPVDLHDANPDAIMEIWYPGSEGGHAVANLLFGDASPGGKLPFTWLRNAAQAPLIYGHVSSHAPESADRRYWNESNAPVYPFGYGLSYTTFKYENIRTAQARYAVGEPVTVTVDVSNTGARAGDEVAQLYIHQRYGASARPVRTLKGFQRAALAPHETRTLYFVLSADDLRYWSSATNGWVADETVFDVWVGGSSAATLAASFEVGGH